MRESAGLEASRRQQLADEPLVPNRGQAESKK